MIVGNLECEHPYYYRRSIFVNIFFASLAMVNQKEMCREKSRHHFVFMFKSRINVLWTYVGENNGRELHEKMFAYVPADFPLERCLWIFCYIFSCFVLFLRSRKNENMFLILFVFFIESSDEKTKISGGNELRWMTRGHLHNRRSVIWIIWRRKYLHRKMVSCVRFFHKVSR